MVKNLFLLFSICCSFCLQAHPDDTLPTVDLDAFLSQDPTKQEAFVTQLGEALNTYGFVLIKNHKIPNHLIDSAYESTKQFFALPLETKQFYQGLELNRGYKGYDPNRLDKKSDLQEYWHVGPQLNPQLCKELNIPEIQENIWPHNVDAFKETLSDLYQDIACKCQPLLEACSLYMGKDKGFLSNLSHYGDSIMRVIHYLPDASSSTSTEWKAPHRDPNLLTVIVGISKNGLELQTRGGKWIKVPYDPDAIVVSASNMLENLSNGLIRSAPHRVVITERDVSRYSIPFFFHVQRDLSIGPQKECVAKTGGQALYPEHTAAASLKDHAWFK